MMKKWKTTVLVSVLCLALLVCLTGCSSDSEVSASDDSGTSPVGSWTVIGIDEGHEVLTGNDLSMIGEDTTVLIEDGGSCSMDTNGDVVDGTWKLDGDTITMTYGSTTLTGTVKPNEIEVEGGMTLQRTEEGYAG